MSEKMWHVCRTKPSAYRMIQAGKLPCGNPPAPPPRRNLAAQAPYPHARPILDRLVNLVRSCGGCGRPKIALAAPEPQPSGAVERVVSFVRAEAQHAWNGARPADEATQQLRWTACHSCDKYTTDRIYSWLPASLFPGPWCRQCGCQLPLKIRMPHSRCPLEKWGPAAVSAEATPPPDERDHPQGPGEKIPRCLVQFPGGIGDVVCTLIALGYLRRVFPEIEFDAELDGRGVRFASPFCTRALARNQAIPGSYDLVSQAHYQRPYDRMFGDRPSTSDQAYIRNVLGLPPIPELNFYPKYPFDDETLKKARSVLGGFASRQGSAEKLPIALFHYSGSSMRDRKDLPEEALKPAVQAAADAGLRPVILDFDGRSRLAESWGAGLVRERGDLLDGAALIEASTLFFGIDSGPSHLAACTSTPAVVTWTGHHPVHNFGLADNVVHLVPTRHAAMTTLPPAGRVDGLAYFHASYRYHTYESLPEALGRLCATRIAEIQERSSAYRLGLPNGAAL
jgi:hypothetical protein